MSVGTPQKKIGDRHLTPQEYDRYQEAAGKRAYSALSLLIPSPVWGKLDDEAKQDAVSKAMKLARGAARAELFGGSTPKGKSGKVSVPPPPPGATLDGEAGGVNVYQDIQKAIPGIRFTSGFRTPAYQDDMRRRGYRPDPNSGHLDGSKLDLLPPAGKSMDWLKRQVRQFRPDAVLNNEGDHLDVRFPGYYGAPPLGGAKAAGIRNPLAGMPPPPPGFKLDAR